jgi:hypothetical protein
VPEQPDLGRIDTFLLKNRVEHYWHRHRPLF